jgi:alanine racemase
MSLMTPSEYVTVTINLNRICGNVERIVKTAGVPVIAVVKADAYGVGAVAVAAAVKDLVEGFYVLHAAEAVDAKLKETGKRTIAMLAPSEDAKDYLEQNVQPVVWSAQRAEMLAKAKPVLSVDTGQQRFAADVDEAEKILAGEACGEAITHATNLKQVELFRRIVDGHENLFLHAAGSSLLNEPAARLSAVRPGLAIYRDAVRVSSRLVEAKDSNGPAGYSGFVVRRFGVIHGGYSHGLRRGPCLVNGRMSRLLEVGMQSSFVEIESGDRVGDEVVLLGDGLAVETIATEWRTTPHEVLLKLAGSGRRSLAK